VHKPYVTITRGMRGYFAVLLSWNHEYGGFYEPFNTGVGSYKTAAQAEPEAKDWAIAEEVEYIPPKELTHG
jgi:hypothetical protein